MMETWTTPCGKERNRLKGDDEGSALPVSDRLQSPLVITGPDGKIMTWDTPQKKFVPWSASSKFKRSKVKQQLLGSREYDASSCIKPNPGIPTQLGTSQPGCLTPQPSRTNGLLATPRRYTCTPGRPPKTPLGPDYAATPITPPSKARPPMSSCKKPQSKSRMKLRMLDDQELQASRVVQARQDLLMERQERAYTAWLNHIFKLLPTGGSQVPNVEDSVSRKFPLTSLCSNFSLLSSDLQLFHEAGCDKDSVVSQFRDPAYFPSRLLRSPLAPLNGVGNRGFRSAGVVNSDKRASKNVLSTDESESNEELSPASLRSSSKKLRMITEHGYSHSRDIHMQDVGQISELARRLALHFGESEAREILAVITLLAQHIDEGRLRMKKGCIILTDVALRKKAIHVLLNYNACWMRIGLHVVFGQTALLGETWHQDGSKQTLHKGVQEAQFESLKVFIKRHFIAHSDRHTESATKKIIEGLYRDEHPEPKGRAILKRFFLLVLVLDKLKCRTALKITDGIDGVDGGSPPLFRSEGTLKSSRQVLQEFLSGVMHGEGDLIDNLSAFGYHVRHYQVPLADYDFAVVNLIEDLQDGVRLCRLVQLLAKNDSRMLEHIQVPSNGRKRHLHNCQIALEGLASAGVPLEDEDGRSIYVDDIIDGKKEKVFALLWNIMVHLQIPVLVSRARLCQEIAKLQGTEGRVALGLNVGTVELLLKWSQVTCMISGNFSVRNFKSSFGDGHAFFLILKLYLPHLLSESVQLLPACPSHFEEQIGNTPDGKVTFSSTYKKVVAHNFGLVQDVARKLGSIPEVLQLEDLLVYPEISQRNIVVFIAFLCSFLLKDNALVLDTQKLGRICQDADPNNGVDEQQRCGSQRNLESESLSGFNHFYSVRWQPHEAPCGTMLPEVYHRKTQVNENSQRTPSEDIVGKVCKIQAWWRARSNCPHVSSLQTTTQKVEGHRVSAHVQAHRAAVRIQAHWRGYVVKRMLKNWTAAAAAIQLRYRAVRNHRREQAAHLLQCCFRAWAQKRNYRATVSNMCKIQAFWWANQARGNFERERKAVHTIEGEWLHYVARRRLQRSLQTRWQRFESAILIQAQWRGYCTRRILKRRSSASVIIQSWVRGHFQRRECRLQKQRIQHAHVARIQACWRGRVVKRKFIEVVRAAKTIQGAWRFLKALRTRQENSRAIKVDSSTRIQACWRGVVARRTFHLLRQAATKIQRAWRQWKAELTQRAVDITCSTRIQARWRGLVARRKLFLLKQAATKIQQAWRQRKRKLADRASRVDSSTRIQASWRGLVARRKLYLLNKAATGIQRAWRHRKRELTVRATLVDSSTRIQACWRGVVARRNLHLLKQAATKIQLAWRKWKRKLANRAAKVDSGTRIQACWRGFIARRKLFLLKHAATKIQRAWRHRKRELADRATIVDSSTRIQACWRGLIARRQLYLLKQAATRIQSAWRQRKMELTDKATRVDSSTRIQACWRGLVARRKLCFQKQSAAKIQAWWRKHAAVLQFEIQTRAARKIQRNWRHWISSTRIEGRGRERTHLDAIIYRTLEASALARQSFQDGHLREKRIQRVLPTDHRAFLQRRIREVFPSNMESRSLPEGKGNAHSANLRVNKEPAGSSDIFRDENGDAEDTNFILMPTSPTLSFQMEARKQDGNCLPKQLAPDGSSSGAAIAGFARAIREGINVETWEPGYLRSVNIDRVDNGTRCLSAGNVIDMSLLACNTLNPKKLNAALRIFSWFKTFAQRAHYLKLRSCVVVIQRHIRGRINRSRFARMKASAIRVQAHWRGHTVRLSQNHPENPLRELRHKIRTNAAGVQDSARIYNRLAEALSTLPHQETVSGILSTCRTIDVATEHSHSCCEQLAQAGAITTILLLIQTINRSPPLEQVLKHALSILSNLARYSPLATQVAQSPSAISIISEQLHSYRNDEGIFLKAISVLQIVCTTSAGIEVLQRDRSIVRRLLLIAQSLEGNILSEKRTVEALPRTTTPAAMQRKSAQTKMWEVIYKLLTTIGLVNDVNGLLHYRTPTPSTPLQRQQAASTPAQRVRLVAHVCPGTKRVGTPKHATTARQALSPRNGRSFSQYAQFLP